MLYSVVNKLKTNKMSDNRKSTSEMIGNKMQIRNKNIITTIIIIKKKERKGERKKILAFVVAVRMCLYILITTG